MQSPPSVALSRRLESRGIYDGRVVAAVSFFTLITVAGLCSTVGVLIRIASDRSSRPSAGLASAEALA